MKNFLTNYISQINDIYTTGNATEHSYRPALKELIEKSFPDLQAINEPKRIKCGAPDFVINRKEIPVGYIECKDVDKSFAEIRITDQFRRYNESLQNLILTDYLNFYWLLI